MSQLNVVVTGVTGQMGRAIVQQVRDADDLCLAGATTRASSSSCDDDIAELLGCRPTKVLVRGSLSQAIEDAKRIDGNLVVVDFSAANAFNENMDAAVEHRVPIVVGTTGLTDDQLACGQRASEHIPVLIASNTSLGANLLFSLTEIASRALPDVDAEIFEIHHRKKRDAPSGTALSLRDALLDGRGVASGDQASLTQLERRDAPRRDGEVGVVAARGGDVRGEHTVYFFLDDERIELTHRASSRDIFARGALVAARFVVDKAPSRYTMKDVLGL